MAEYPMTLKDRQRVARDTMAFWFDTNGVRYEFRPGQHADFGFRTGNVVERECGLDERKTCPRQGAHVVAGNKAVVPLRIDSARLRDHLGRNIHADGLKSKLAEESGRASRSTTEVECRGSVPMGAENFGQVAECEVVGVGEFKFRVGFSSGRVFVAIDEVGQRLPSVLRTTVTLRPIYAPGADVRLSHTKCKSPTSRAKCAREMGHPLSSC